MMMVKETTVVLYAAMAVLAVAVAIDGGKEKHNEAEKMLKGCDKAIFLLAGQSNMAGRGGIKYKHGPSWDGQTPSLCQPDPRIIRLNDEKQWEEAREPLHQNISFARCLTNGNPFGVGPGMPFANTLLAIHPAIGTIGLVPCAVGNTEISQWMRGRCLYNRLLARAQASLRDGGSLRGMLWYQGENDCKPELAEKYEDRLKAFFNDIRNDLMLPSLPIIQVALDSAKAEDPSVKKVRSVQLNLNLPNLRTVDAQDLPRQDTVHLTTDSQVKLGSKLAREYVKYFI